MNSKWIIARNVKCKTIKLLADNTGENLCDIANSDDFLDRIPRKIHERNN